MSPIVVVGIGLAGAADLSSTAQAAVDQATLLVGGQRHLSYFANHVAPKLTLGDLSSALEQIQDHLAISSQNKVVILASGDPLFFGLGRLLLTTFSTEQLTFHPHLSAVQLAFSRIKVPWQDANIVSLHGRSPERLIQALQKGDDKIAIFTDPTYTPAAIAQLFLTLDLPVAYQFWVCEDLGSPSEQVQRFAPFQLLGQTFAALNIVILIRLTPTPSEADWPHLGLPDGSFLSFPDRPSLITKREVRVLALAELDLHENQIIWDIGAGTGSVAIETARISASSTVYAVEKTVMGHRLIQENCRRFAVSNVEAICGTAPDALAALPPPDRIFIGGSGGNLSTILDCCQIHACKQTVIVLAIATLETLEIALHWLRTHHWSTQLLQIQVSRSVPIATLTRWQPLNPVTLIRANLKSS
ncbi:MAG: precorrin-6y C5,15-methyltransferase (decarboxylating) subunit CbiE [Cyanobacteria bacterium P01_A01_bin.17]